MNFQSKSINTLEAQELNSQQKVFYTFIKVTIQRLTTQLELWQS